MFGRHHELRTLAARKRLLVAESELNRAQLTGDLQGLTAGIHGLTQRASAGSAVVRSATALAAGVAAFMPAKEPKPSRTQTVLKSAGCVITLWLAFLARRGPQAK